MVIVPAFIESEATSIKLSILGILTVFGRFSFFNVTVAFVPSAVSGRRGSVPVCTGQHGAGNPPGKRAGTAVSVGLEPAV